MKLEPEGNRFIKEVIEQEEYKFLMDYPVVVDVGANIGTFSVWIYDHAEKIYALEPIPAVYEMLKLNIENNQLSKIKAFNLALAKDSGRRMMRLDPKPENGGSKLIDNSKGDLEVECRTLVDFMREEEIAYVDLLKIDVEGAEREILQFGFPAKQVGTIIGERHNEANVKELLQDLGYNYIDKGGHFIARR